MGQKMTGHKTPKTENYSQGRQVKNLNKYKVIKK